jgi:hypothetical protein
LIDPSSSNSAAPSPATSSISLEPIQEKAIEAGPVFDVERRLHRAEGNFAASIGADDDSAGPHSSR